MRPAAVSPAYSKYASSTTSGRAAGNEPSAPVGLFGRQQNVTVGDSSPSSAPARCAATRKTGYVGVSAMATESPALANERAHNMMRSSAPAPRTTFSGSTPAYCAMAATSSGNPPWAYSFVPASAPAIVPGRAVGDGAAGTFPSKRTISTGSRPTSAAISLVDGAQRYSANSEGSALIGGPPRRGPPCPPPQQAPRRWAAAQRALRQSRAGW